MKVRVVLRDVVLCRLREVKPKSNGLILPNGKKDSRVMFDEHPFKMEVVYRSADCDWCMEGEVLYMDRFPDEREQVMVGKEVLWKVLKGNVMCIEVS